MQIPRPYCDRSTQGECCDEHCLTSTTPWCQWRFPSEEEVFEAKLAVKSVPHSKNVGNLTTLTRFTTTRAPLACTNKPKCVEMQCLKRSKRTHFLLSLRCWVTTWTFAIQASRTWSSTVDKRTSNSMWTKSAVRGQSSISAARSDSAESAK